MHTEIFPHTFFVMLGVTKDIFVTWLSKT